MSYDDFIHDRGRGPEIKGTRITVFCIIDFLLTGWPADRIAVFYRLSTHQVQAAMDYIEDHKVSVMAEYARKYADGWPRFADSFREGFKSGERVLVRYRPAP